MLFLLLCFILISFVNGFCKYNFKVYVYPLSSDLSVVSLGELSRRKGEYHVCLKCILEQFSLEYIFNDFFTQFCGRTNNPDEADFFYLPIYRDVEYRKMKDAGKRDSSEAEVAILRALEENDTSLLKSYFNITDKYWNRRKGGDHIFIMPAPVTNFRHQVGARGFSHYMIHNYPPIFFNIEYSKPFVQEYPICATKKNMVVPYPVIDPFVYTGKYLKEAAHFDLKKEYLIYYAGLPHGVCPKVRHALAQEFKSAEKVMLNLAIPEKFAGMGTRELGFIASKYCPVPVGDSPSSKRMYDVLAYGCIPVVLSDELVWAFSPETGGRIDPSSYSLTFPHKMITLTMNEIILNYNSQTFPGKLPVSGILYYDLLVKLHKDGTDHSGKYLNRTTSIEIGEILPEYINGVYIGPFLRLLNAIPKEDYLYLKTAVDKVRDSFYFYAFGSNETAIPIAHSKFPDGSAWDEIGHHLQALKDAGIEKVRDDCLNERRQKHLYKANNVC